MGTQTFDHRSGRIFAAEGARLYVEEVGDPAAPPLLLLHGGLGTIRDFDLIVPHLVKSFRVIGIDARGHGRSTLGPYPLSYARLEADVRHVLKQFGLAHFDLLGFSDGGIVAYRLALSPPPGLGRIVTVGADARLEPDDPVRGILSRVTAEGWRSRFPEGVAVYERVNPEPDLGRLVAAVVPMWLDSGADGYPGDRVAAIDRELLIVRGDEDHLVSRRALALLASEIPGARFLNLPFAGHVAFDGLPEIFLEIVTRFLAKGESPGEAMKGI